MLDATQDMDAGLSLGAVQNLSDAVRAHLLAEVTAGLLTPGDRINEAELARRLGISRNPVREAVAGLVRQGFLVARPRRGAFLREFSAKDVEDVFSFRICVESFALRLAIARGGPDFGREMLALAHRMTAAAEAGDVAAVQDLDILFHRTICVHSDNAVTLRAHEAIDVEVRVLIALVDLAQEPLADAAAVHLEMAEAMARGEAERAVGLLSAHVLQTRRFVLDRHVGGGAGAAPGDGPAAKKVRP